MSAPAISLVCSTVGRTDALTRQLDALVACELAEQIEFILVDQSVEQACAQLVADRGLPGPWKVATSGRGASVGRNVGVGLATAPVIAFPDDNCWYAPDTVRRVLTVLAERPDIDGLSAKQVAADGSPSMLRWLDHEVEITRNNFMRTSICSTLFLRRAALPSAAPFDEGIGTGSPGWRGSGEESDLLLRLLAAGSTVLYRPDIVVYQDDDRTEPGEDYVDKMLRYGVGIGHLWRRHRLPVRILAYYSGRKVVGAVVRAARGERIRSRADRAYLRGTVAGWRGITP
ncbi:glycosyltransferase [Mycobacterium sp. NBC_00419]|uniref:glycosyltransferase family 2 protein n=1 Tax=Mycobacterium sp. NBC_00419 TaxID=2975989 RepID=UPI002E233B9E